MSDLEQQRVREAVQYTLDAFWLAFDGMVRAFVRADPLYAAWREPARAEA